MLTPSRASRTAPVSIFLGLILLAIVLLVTGVILLVGFENIRNRVSGDTAAPVQSGIRASGKDLAEASDAVGITPRSALRPYRVAKSHGQSHNDQMIGLLLVLAGLGMLYIVPFMLFSSRSKEELRHREPPRWQEDAASRRDRVSSSQAGQGLLGAMTLVVLIASFAMLKPEKKPKKASSSMGPQTLRAQT